ncbi:hypothetical protein BH09MYX1_BH09MYX1_47100 [soil metagenome]
MVRKSLVSLSFLALAAVVPAAITACEVKINEPKTTASATEPPPPAPPPDPTPTTKPAPMPQLRAVGRVKIEGDKVSIPGELVFDFGKSDINEKKETNGSILAQLKEFLDQNASVTKLRIEGHTDDIGKPDDNMKLSQQRAEAVVKWLTTHGIAATRVHAIGFGETRPKAKNDTDPNRALNRRTEFHVEEIDGRTIAGMLTPPPASAAPSASVAASASASASAKPGTSASVAASASVKPATATSAVPATSASVKK